MASWASHRCAARLREPRGSRPGARRRTFSPPGSSLRPQPRSMQSSMASRIASSPARFPHRSGRSALSLASCTSAMLNPVRRRAPAVGCAHEGMAARHGRGVQLALVPRPRSRRRPRTHAPSSSCWHRRRRGTASRSVWRAAAFRSNTRSLTGSKAVFSCWPAHNDRCLPPQARDQPRNRVRFHGRGRLAEEPEADRDVAAVTMPGPGERTEQLHRDPRRRHGRHGKFVPEHPPPRSSVRPCANSTVRSRS